MFNVIRRWLDRLFEDEEALLLIVLIAALLGLVLWLGDVLTPVIAALILAFIMQGPVGRLQRKGVPQFAAVLAVYSIAMGALLAFMLFLGPLISQQMTAFFAEVPSMLGTIRVRLAQLSTYSDWLTEEQVNQWLGMAAVEAGRIGQQLLSVSLASLPEFITALVYTVLVPILVFFFLKDKDSLLGWPAAFLPRQRPLLMRVWHEMNQQVANYVRGKALEILIVGIASFITFVWLDLNYAALLALLVGISVVIPYIGAVVVTVPVTLVAYIQWGWQPDFFYLVGVYLIIQVIDGNVLVPLLFSEAVNLHPVAIIVAVLVFGGLWGFWGVFFAIPLATLIKAIVAAWPRQLDRTMPEPNPL